MKTIKLVSIFLTALTLFAVSAEAQRRRAPVKRAAPKVVATPISTTNDLRTAKDKVSNQITNVTRFVDVLGKISIGIENVDKESKTKRLPQKALDENAANKTKVIQAIRNLRAGLNALETDFRTKPVLRKYLLNIEGIAGLSAQAEDTAVAGRFADSGRPLLLVVEKLSKTLGVMP